MKSMLVAYDYPPMGGGIARALSEIARPEALGPVVVHTGPAGASRDRLGTLNGVVAWVRDAHRVARAHDIEFTWAGNLKPAGYVARWLRVRRGTPYGIVVYGHDLLKLRRQMASSRRKRLIARSLLGQASVLVGISDWTTTRCRELLHDLGLPGHASRLLTVPLGADPVTFSPEGTRADLGAGRWLVTVARLVPHKGIDRAIEALSLLGPEHADVHYAVVGDGPDLTRLTKLAARHGVASRVRFLTDVPDAALPTYYRAATLYLGLSRTQGDEAEGFGLSLAEAQACGVPVLASDAGGMRDAMRDGRTGWLVPADDPDAIATMMRAVLGSPGRIREAGLEGRRLVERELNWQRVGAALRRAQEQAGR